jgi:hypothetical protein
MCGICFTLSVALPEKLRDDNSNSNVYSDLVDKTCLWQSLQQAVLSRGQIYIYPALSRQKSKDTKTEQIGPDLQSSVVKEIACPLGPAVSTSGSNRSSLLLRESKWVLRFHTAVLHMRGTKVTRQPFVSPPSEGEDDVLLFVRPHTHLGFLQEPINPACSEADHCYFVRMAKSSMDSR